MAESTSTSGSSSTPSTPSTTATTPPASKQYIRATADDNALEPDAMRGSEHVLRDMKIQDDEADRRKAIEDQTPKAS